MLPLLVHSRRAFLAIKLITLLIGTVVGAIPMSVCLLTWIPLCGTFEA
jgi:hypothetical protein